MTPAVPAHAPARRRSRLAVLLWVAMAVVVWHGLYDLRISLGVRDYLMHAALHEAGRGPAVSMSDMMRHTVRDAVQIATLWASIILVAGIGTVALIGRANRTPGGTNAAGQDPPHPRTV